MRFFVPSTSTSRPPKPPRGRGRRMSVHFVGTMSVCSLLVGQWGCQLVPVDSYRPLPTSRHDAAVDPFSPPPSTTDAKPPTPTTSVVTTQFRPGPLTAASVNTGKTLATSYDAALASFDSETTEPLSANAQSGGRLTECCGYTPIPPPCECCEQPTFGEDLSHFTLHTFEDAWDVLNADNLLVLGLTGGGAIALHQDADDRVRRWTARHPERWGDAAETLGDVGDYPVQLSVLVGMYAYSRFSEDDQLDDFAGTLLRAYTVNAAYTVLLKGIANTDRPTDKEEGGRYGFPSFHASSNFAVAAVIDEYYGLDVALPMYAFAGAVSYSRIDERVHDLSDVLYGAVLGYVIGKSVARKHCQGDSRAIRIFPYVHPTEGASGLMFEKTY